MIIMPYLLTCKGLIMITMKIKILNRFIDNIIPIKPRE